MKSKTHVIIIIDESGSMWKLESDVIGGFNSYLAALKEDNEYDYYLTVTKFSYDPEILFDNEPLNLIPNLDKTLYSPMGSTALLDAIGQSIAAFNRKNPELPEGERVILVINTDGRENSSKEYTKDMIRSIIKEQQEKGWAVLYLGQHLDSFHDAEELGIMRESTVEVQKSSVGTKFSYESLGRATRGYSRGMSGQSVAAEIKADQDVI